MIILPFGLTQEAAKKGALWLTWIIVVLATINFVIALVATTGRGRLVLSAADGLTCALALGAQFFLRKRWRGAP